eukprot:superscaffoldBa00002585_g14730
MPGGPVQIHGVSWTQAGKQGPGPGLGCRPGASDAPFRKTLRDQPDPRGPTTASSRLTHSPVLQLFRSKIPTIRLRHLLAQRNTHGAFSGILPEGIVVNGDDLSYRLLPTRPPSAMTASNHWAAPQ